MNKSIDILFSKNLYLVDKVLSKIRPQVHPATLEEIEADAMIGLWDALRLYDPACRKNFKHYAYKKIRYAIKDGLRERDPFPREFRNSNGDPIEIADVDELEEDHPRLVYSDTGTMDLERREYVKTLLNQIDRHLAELLYMRFWLGLTDIQIAEQKNLNRKRVARQIQQALDELKKITSEEDAY